MKVKLPNGKYGELEDGIVTKRFVFASKNQKRQVDTAKFLTEQHGGNVDDWKHVRGEAVINQAGILKRAEVHWFENKEFVVDLKVKRWFNES